jgi:hypothetical protein
VKAWQWSSCTYIVGIGVADEHSGSTHEIYLETASNDVYCNSENGWKMKPDVGRNFVGSDVTGPWPHTRYDMAEDKDSINVSVVQGPCPVAASAVFPYLRRKAA